MNSALVLLPDCEKGKDALINVDLDVEQGRQYSNGKNKFRVILRHTGDINFNTLSAYLAGKADFHVTILETLSFLDHLMRQTPSKNFTQIKKSFFARGQTRALLGGGVEAFKGVFASMRMVHSISGPCLSVNVDVSNGTFFTQMYLVDMLRELCRARTKEDVIANFNRSKKDWHKSPMYRALRSLTHVTVLKTTMPSTDGKPAPEFKIHRFLNKDSYEASFNKDQYDDAGNKVGTVKTIVADYFRKTYKVNCARGLPVVELTNKDLIPVDYLHIPQNQRYKVKLDEKQTSNVSFTSYNTITAN